MKIVVQGKEILFDKADLPIVQKYKWYINDGGYAVWRGEINGEKKTIRLHRLIAHPTDGLVVDHINRNKLDNRRANLRCVTQKINARNTDRCEQAKGYYRRKNNPRGYKREWVVDYKGVSNTFASEEDAKKAVERIKNGSFVKEKVIRHNICSTCGGEKQIYGGAWTCRECARKRCKRYYERCKADGRIKMHPKERKEYCLRGHPRTPENLTSNGTCKICNRERSKNVKTKKR